MVESVTCLIPFTEINLSIFLPIFLCLVMGQAPNFCNLPKMAGTSCCKALPRFYFDNEDGECKNFTYNGCNGNENRFLTLKDCQWKCVCTLPVVVGTCRRADPRYYFDKQAAECKSFTYGGCGGNKNNFETLKGCQEMCDVCKLPKEVGPCFAYFKRYYFDKQAGECKEFIYGGCGGNRNKFNTKNACEERCEN